MKHYITAIKQYISRRKYLLIPIFLASCTITGGIHSFFGLNIYEYLILVQFIFLAIAIDFGWYVVNSYNIYSYKLISEKEITKYYFVDDEVNRKNINNSNKFIPRALIAKSKHELEIMPLCAKLSSFYHEFRRSENSALKWKNIDIEGIKKSFSSNKRKEKSYDHIRIIENSVNLLKTRVVFNPPVELKDGSVKINFTRRYNGAQFLSLEDIAKAIEYGKISETRPFCIQGRKVAVETDKLYISVEFPSIYKVEKFLPRVTNQGEIIADIQESLSIVETRENGFTRAELKVPKHLIRVGNVYSITWLPPSIKELRKNEK